jgi:murein DD-endopeptidase MepM/ murein hydrolase activator NlpD
MIKHSGEDLNLGTEAPVYYSEFDHLKFDDVKDFSAGQRISRGQVIGRVYRPGGHKKYLPEVHWEVWEVGNDGDLFWKTNKFGGKFWFNKTARLIDPLYLLSRNTPPSHNGRVTLTPFVNGDNYDGFRGFTYILPCQRDLQPDKTNQPRTVP